MIYDPQKVISIALAEVDYLEKASNAQLDDKTANAGSKNYTKYARDLAKIPWFNGSKTGVAWCSVFVSWVFVQAFGPAVARKLLCQPSAKNNCGAGCGSAMRYFREHGRLFDAPEPGDVIFFFAKDLKTVSHTGVVVKVDKARVYTIEGNTSGDSGVVANGGGVFAKSYALGYSRIAGYGSPDWRYDDPDDTKEVSPMPTIYPYPARVATSGGGLNLRKAPSTTAGRILLLSNGSTLTVLADAGEGWLKVQAGTQTGYCSAEYIKPDEPAGTTGPVVITLLRNEAEALLAALNAAMGR